MSQYPIWYKDAVFYELHVKAFHDSNGDGNGDFKAYPAARLSSRERVPEERRHPSDADHNSIYKYHT
jgi:hypothetical protein